MDNVSVFHAISFALAVCAGAFLRFSLSTFVGQFFARIFSSSSIFPWGVFMVNLLGCFGFGLTMGFSERFSFFQEIEKTILFTGFFGSFTTFSTFIFDIYSLYLKAYYKHLFFFIFGQISIGTSLIYFGLWFFS